MKELAQIKLILPFNIMPSGIGRQRALRDLDARVTNAIRNDTLKKSWNDLHDLLAK